MISAYTDMMARQTGLNHKSGLHVTVIDPNGKIRLSAVRAMKTNERLFVFNLKTLGLAKGTRARHHIEYKSVSIVITEHGRFPVVDTVLVFRGSKFKIVDLNKILPGDCAVSCVRGKTKPGVPAGMVDVVTTQGTASTLYLHDIVSVGTSDRMVVTTTSVCGWSTALHNSRYYIPC
jgi:hypothetical protein